MEGRPVKKKRNSVIKWLLIFISAIYLYVAYLKDFSGGIWIFLFQLWLWWIIIWADYIEKYHFLGFISTSFKALTGPMIIEQYLYFSIMNHGKSGDEFTKDSIIIIILVCFSVGFIGWILYKIITFSNKTSEEVVIKISGKEVKWTLIQTVSKVIIEYIILLIIYFGVRTIFWESLIEIYTGIWLLALALISTIRHLNTYLVWNFPEKMNTAKKYILPIIPAFILLWFWLSGSWSFESYFPFLVYIIAISLLWTKEWISPQVKKHFQNEIPDSEFVSKPLPEETNQK